MISFRLNRKEAIDNLKKRKIEMMDMQKSSTFPSPSVAKTVSNTPIARGVAQDSCSTPSKTTSSFSDISPRSKRSKYFVSILDEQVRLEKKANDYFIDILKDSAVKVETFSFTNRKGEIMKGVIELLEEFLEKEDSDEEENEK
jgi:hypothetical protein